MRSLRVGPLADDAARRLAVGLLGSDGPADRQTADEIVREAGGSPFLIEELVRSEGMRAGVPTEVPRPGTMLLRLDAMLAARAARLTTTERVLLELVAIGGRPLPVKSIGEAAGTGDSTAQLLALLQARSLVRLGLRNGVEIVETIHDRVRETLVKQLSDDTARAHHAKLAGVLARDPDADPEAIALHLLGAGEKGEAARYAERAGEQAISKLAFAQAARLFQLTIQTVPWPAPDLERLHRRAAEAAEWAGLPEQAARSYLAAAGSASELGRVDLERAAAAQLIAAGRIDEGAEIFRRVLAAVDRPVPTSVLGAIFWAIIYRFAHALLRPPTAPRSEKLSDRERLRLDALSSATRGLTVVDPISALYVKARYLHDALRIRDYPHIIHAAASEGGTLASAGGPVGKRERALFDLAKRLADESKDREGLALYEITYGISLYLRGQCRDAVTRLDAACRVLAAARRWSANANVYAVYALVSLGDLQEVRARTQRLVADAERRGDRYTTVSLRASHPIAVWLAADDPEGARRSLNEAMASWSRTRFLVQHWQAMLWETMVALYQGDGARAWERLSRDARSLRRSHLLSVQLLRVDTYYLRGCVAIASLADGVERSARLAQAEGAERKLRAEAIPWAQPLADVLAAAVARARCDAARAERSLRRAADRATAADMPTHALACRHQLGAMLGEQGKTLEDEAAMAMRALGVRVPERYATMLVPGAWRPRR
jgi:hypothetical protein